MARKLLFAALGAVALIIGLAFWLREPLPRPLPLRTLGADATKRYDVRFVGTAGDFDGDAALDVLAIQTDELDPAFPAYVRVFSGRTGALALDTRIGAQVADAVAVACDDLDDDGQADVVVGLPSSSGTASTASPGRVIALSGRDGREIARAESPRVDDGFGARLAVLGDVDGDGASDVAIGSPWLGARRPRSGRWTFRGRVEARSGRTLSALFVVDGERDDSSFGAELASLDDVDGDGVRDWIASSLLDEDTGEIRVHSGRTGALLRVTRGESARFGRSLAVLGDCDGDGAADFATCDGDRFETQRVEVRSGRDGRVLVRVDAPPRESMNWLEPFGSVLGAPGDVDRDGLVDVFVAAPTWKYRDNGYGFGGGRAWIRSGRTGALLAEFRNEGGLDGLGSFFAPLGDADCDGAVELVAATQRDLRVYATR